MLVTEKYVMNISLEESLKNALLHAIPDTIIQVNRDGIILAIKPSIDFPLRISASEAPGKTITELFSKEIANHYLDAIDDALSSQEVQSFEHPCIANGREKHCEIRIFPINFEQALLLIRDVTEYKKVERMKVDLVSFASHQLRTPAAEISGLANNLLGNIAGKLTSRQKQYVEFIKEISTRNLRLIADLLNVSKLEGSAIAVSLEPVSLNEILNLALRTFNTAKKGLTLKRIEDEKIVVSADLGKSVEAVRNVVENALRFTEKGNITVRTRRNDRYGIIEVSDTGPGIEEGVLSKIFTKEMILSASPNATGEGTGLGLYIAKKFMDLQRGDLKVSSAIGKGSAFTFSFPLR